VRIPTHPKNGGRTQGPRATAPSRRLSHAPPPLPHPVPLSRVAQKKAKSDSDIASCYIESSRCFIKAGDSRTATELLETEALPRMVDAGRLSQAAKLHQEVAEMFEDEGQLDEAMNNYQKAADFFNAENAASTASKCLGKIALLAAQVRGKKNGEGGREAKEAEEKEAAHAQHSLTPAHRCLHLPPLSPPTGRRTRPTLSAPLGCSSRSAATTSPATCSSSAQSRTSSTQSSARSRAGTLWPPTPPSTSTRTWTTPSEVRMMLKNKAGRRLRRKPHPRRPLPTPSPPFPSPPCAGSRECKLLEDVCQAFKDGNNDAFTDAVFNYDQISKLDPWRTSILLRIKSQIQKSVGEGGDLT
jgi:hypothetical protein